MNIDVNELYSGPEQKALVESATSHFLEAFQQHIAPTDGAENLLKYLRKTDFFIAPASTQYHGNHPGGLVVHSLFVYKRLQHLVHFEKNLTEDPKVHAITDESIAKAALLHDLCKIDVYKPSTKNVKNESGVWEKVPYYKFEETLPYGHGEKSVYVITGFIKLTRDEAMAVRWHMGAFDDSVKGSIHGSSALGLAFETHPLALLLHHADVLATHFDETKLN